MPIGKVKLHDTRAVKDHHGTSCWTKRKWKIILVSAPLTSVLVLILGVNSDFELASK